MLFEDLDKKIRDAAEQHHPAYDEKAWLKMEKLLNQHLPQQKNDRRRIIFFFLLFLLIGGGTFMVISKPWSKKPISADQLAQDNKKKVQAKNNKKTGNVPFTQPGRDKINKDAGGNGNVLINQEAEKTTDNEPINGKSLGYSKKNKTTGKSRLIKNQGTENKKKSFLDNNGDKNIAASDDKMKKPPLGNNLGSPVQPGIKSMAEKKEEDKTKTGIAKQDEIKENINQEVAKTEIKKAAKKNNQSKNQNGFSFSVSAGSDISKAGGSKTGKTTLVYGAGIGYTRKRFTLRTGMYVSKKIYWAGPNDYELSYKPPPQIKFEGADANCYVIDIPVKLSYNFESGRKGNWFAGAGLSSYLMKRETYVYNYKNSWGNTYPIKYEVKNENKHYFSVLSLSGGYTRRLNNTFSISAEPYVEIPLTGIGVGKVHLNSGGVLMTLSVKPFRN